MIEIERESPMDDINYSFYVICSRCYTEFPFADLDKTLTVELCLIVSIASPNT